MGFKGRGNQNWKTSRELKQFIRNFFEVADLKDMTDGARVDYMSELDQLRYLGCNQFYNPPWSDLENVCSQIVKYNPSFAVVLRHFDVSPNWNQKYFKLFNWYFLSPRVAYVDPTSNERNSPDRGTCMMEYPGTGKAKIVQWKNV